MRVCASSKGSGDGGGDSVGEEVVVGAGWVLGGGRLRMIQQQKSFQETTLVNQKKACLHQPACVSVSVSDVLPTFQCCPIESCCRRACGVDQDPHRVQYWGN